MGIFATFVNSTNFMRKLYRFLIIYGCFLLTINLNFFSLSPCVYIPERYVLNFSFVVLKTCFSFHVFFSLFPFLFSFYSVCLVPSSKHTERDVENLVKDSLRNLQTNYIDLWVELIKFDTGCFTFLLMIHKGTWSIGPVHQVFSQQIREIKFNAFWLGKFWPSWKRKDIWGRLAFLISLLSTWRNWSMIHSTKLQLWIRQVWRNFIEIC